MESMVISIVHPSRSRAARAKQVKENWLSSVSGKHEIEYILSIDLSDPQREAYETLFNRDIIVIENNDCCVQAVNAGGRVAKGDIIIVVSDDFECFQGWDEAIVKAYEGHSCKVLKTYDGTQKWIVTLPIIDRAYYDRIGYIYHPDYKHMFCDTDMTHLADVSGSLLMRNDIVFKHAHYSTGASEKDMVNEKADSTWNQGMQVYLNRVRSQFGSSTIDIWKINREGLPHLNWLKQNI